MNPYGKYTEYSDEEMMNGFDNVVEDLQKEVAKMYEPLIHDVSAIANFADKCESETGIKIVAVKPKRKSYVGETSDCANMWGCVFYFENGATLPFPIEIEGGFKFLDCRKKYLLTDLGIERKNIELSDYEKTTLKELLKACKQEKKKFKCFMKNLSDTGKVQIWAICEDGTRYGETDLKPKDAYWQLCKYEYYTKKDLGL